MAVSLTKNVSYGDSIAEREVVRTLLKLEGDRKDAYNLDAKQRLLFYRGKHLPMLEEDLRTFYPSSHEDMVRVALNVTATTVRRRAVLYTQSPERIFVDRETGRPAPRDVQRRILDYYEDTLVDEMMGQLEEYAELFEVATVKIVSRPRGEELVEVFPFAVNVQEDPTDRLNIDAPATRIAMATADEGADVEYQIDEDGNVSYQVSAVPKSYELWTTSGAALVEGTRIVKAIPTPIPGAMPFVFFHRSKPTELFPEANDTMTLVQRAVNMIWCDVCHGGRYSVHPEDVVEGADQKTVDNLARGPEFITALPAGATWKKLTADPRLGELARVAVDLARIYAQTEDLGTDLFTLDARQISGAAAELIDLRYLEVNRRKKANRWARRYESELWSKLQRIHDLRNPKKPFGSRWDVRVLHQVLWVPDDPLRESQKDAIDLGLALTDRASVIRRRTGYSLRDAEILADRYEADLEERNAKSQPSPTQAVDGAFKSTPQVQEDELPADQVAQASASGSSPVDSSVQVVE